MTKRIVLVSVALALAVGVYLRSKPAGPQSSIEARIIDHLDANVRPGEPVVVSELFNDVFTTPEEREALDRLYNTFFKIPIFLVQFQTSAGRVPSLEEISEQFNMTTPREADVLLRVMEADPRVPSFFDRDPVSGEVTRIDVEPIRSHPQFGQEIERSLAGWEGRPMPQFATEALDGRSVTSDLVADRPHMIYVWFSNCPPCLETSPLLVDLYREYADSGFEIIAANADRFLELPYDDQMRADYLAQVGIEFPAVHLTPDMQRDYGGVTVFPTMFFANREGEVVRHLVSFQERSVLEEAIQATLN